VSDGHDETWYGIANGIAGVRDACELYGWKEGVKKGLQAIGKLEVPHLPSIKRKKCKASYGASLDVSRMYSGNFEKMWNTTKREITSNNRSKKCLINLVINISSHCGISAESFFWRGALGCCLARALQDSGRKVRILSALSTQEFTYDAGEARGAKNLTTVIEVKKFDQQVEYNTMFSMTALAGFLRYYCFKAILSVPFKVKDCLGRPSPLRVEAMDYLIDDNPTLIIENVWNAREAIEQSKKLVQEVLA
jgi:hypothetical protein